MIDLTIGLHQYKVPSNWSEMTVQNGIDFYAICKKRIPKLLNDKYDIQLNTKDSEYDLVFQEWESKVTENFSMVEVPEFINYVLHYMGNVPMEVLYNTSIESKYNIYINYLETFVIDMLYFGATLKPNGLTHVTINRERYYLPTSKRIGDVVIPMFDLTTEQFAESADLMSFMAANGDGFKFAPYILTLLCLRKGEDYKEDLVEERVEMFKTISMLECWEVFFCLMTFTDTVLHDIRVCLEKENLTVKECPTVGTSLYLTFIPIPNTLFSSN